MKNTPLQLKRFSILLILAITLSLFTANQFPAKSECEASMTTHDADFQNVPFGMDQQTPCSPPRPDLSWRGIALRAPEAVSYNAEDITASGYLAVTIPVCGFLSLDYIAVKQSDSMSISAIEKTTGKIYSAGVGETDPSMMAPDPDEEPADPALLEGMSMEEYFNENLTHYLQLPFAPAIYDIYVEFGPFKSNTVTVAVRR
jgi:hypothetical protein